MEALIRWNDPERGLVPPDEFIPAAEASGLIDEIGRWVIDEVCRQWRTWADEGLTPDDRLQRRAARAAPRGLRARASAAAIARHGVDPRMLVVEITERAAMREPERTDKVLRELKELGARVAIDDFGADHSSLARLRALRGRHPQDRPQLPAPACRRSARPPSIVTAILSLARGARDGAPSPRASRPASSCASSARTAAGRAQGYHIARPMPGRAGDGVPARHPPVIWRCAAGTCREVA